MKEIAQGFAGVFYAVGYLILCILAIGRFKGIW